MRKSCVVVAFCFWVVGCCKGPTATNSQASLSGPAGVDYSRQIGVGVRTDSRTCILIRDATLTPNSFVTLVVPASPQSFADAQIVGVSQEACPITEETQPGTTSYKISLPATAANIPKLKPFFAVVGNGDSNSFAIDNSNVLADLGHTHGKNTFRACGASDGAHLTVWDGVPMTGKLLWSGHYSENGRPGSLPECAAVELGAHS